MVAERRLKTPLENVDDLKIGDIVYLTGMIVTARDKAHMRILEYVKEGKALPVNLSGGVLFHCGPLMRQDKEWMPVAVGPTTSSRMNSLEPGVLEATGVKAIIGKGGMEKNVGKALTEHNAVYLAMPGGCAATASANIEKVEAVHWLEFGMPEALWVFRVKDFGPLVVAMDCRGNSIYEDVKKTVESNLKKINQIL